MLASLASGKNISSALLVQQLFRVSCHIFSWGSLVRGISGLGRRSKHLVTKRIIRLRVDEGLGELKSRVKFSPPPRAF